MTRSTKCWFSLYQSRRALQWLCLTCVCLISQGVHANCIDEKRLVGVNLAGAEFNSANLPGMVNTDYIYPAPEDIRYFHALGMNVIRLPFRWERIQPVLFGELNQAELHSIQAAVATARLLDICMILDVHNYGSFHGKPIGSIKVPIAAFVDLWERLLRVFQDPSDTAFGLMNEPSNLTVANWASIAQQTVDVLREKGSKHLILVSGGRWSGAHDWNATKDGVSNAEAFRFFRDQHNNIAIEIHQYADLNFAGQGLVCVEPARLTKIMENITQWAISTNHHLFLGEFGVAVNENCLNALEAILVSLDDGSAVWRGWTYWAAGRWWGGYPLSIQPQKGKEPSQTSVLRRFLNKRTTQK